MALLLDKVIKEIQSELTPVLENYICRVKNPDLIHILNCALKAKESYDRALFVRLAMESVNSNWHKAIQAMAAVELMDFSVLVIDDILDEAPRRMGDPTVYRKWGLKTAIIAALILKSIAAEALLKAGKENYLRRDEVIRLVAILESAHKQIYLGQYADMVYEEHDLSRVTLKMYLSMIKNTTGIQISASTLIGSILGKGTHEQINALKNYGMFVGMIFQIRDDLIDYLNDESLTGKPPFIDLARKKKRIPLLIAHQVYGKAFKTLFDNIQSNQSIREEIIHKVTSKKVVHFIRQIQKSLAKKAIIAMQGLRDAKSIRILNKVIELGIDI